MAKQRKIEIIPTETQEQITVASWLRVNNILFYHVPNEAKRSIGLARIEIAMGLQSGVPDICIPIARKGFHGLYIEMKSLKGKATENQLKWLKNLKEQGYQCYVCKGADIAIKAIQDYLEG